jgi:SAM-dependent methyltransferase
MKESSIHRTFGRRAFGFDPGGYHAARPAYPDWVFDVLSERCGLAPNAATFEIGAGTGTATRRLLELGANPLVAVEPDDRLATFLRKTSPDKALTVLTATFEEAVLREVSFDLGLSATAFHWLTEDLALTKVAKLLRPGGWWAMVWNVFGDSHRPDPFHEATKILLNGPFSPSEGNGDIPFALDAEARLAALERTHAFDGVEHRTSAWSLVLDPDQTVALYATYSNINIRPDRETVLAELRRLAREEFHSRVTRNMVTSLYVARRRSVSFTGAA